MIASPMLPVSPCSACKSQKIGLVRKKNKPQSMLSIKPPMPCSF